MPIASQRNSEDAMVSRRAAMSERAFVEFSRENRKIVFLTHTFLCQLKSLALFLLILLIPGANIAQSHEWGAFVPLKSSKADVEKILGKPIYFSESVGSYKTTYGKYFVWYASGNCKNTDRERDWNVPAGIVALVSVQPTQVEYIEKFLSNPSDFVRRESPGGYSRFLYTNADESLIYETIKNSDSSEFVSHISIEPGKQNEKLLCKQTSQLP